MTSHKIHPQAHAASDQRLTRRGLLASTGLTIGAGFLAESQGGQAAQTDPSGEPLRELAATIDFQIGSLYSRDRWIRPVEARAPHQEIMAREFNLAIIDGGPLHWGGYGTLRPASDQFYFSPPDEAVAFAEAHKMEVEGHHLVWG
jgi:GH35 family endo-1,4-beta-xylanase